MTRFGRGLHKTKRDHRNRHKSSEITAIMVSTAATTNTRCIIDRTILNEETLGHMDDVGLSIFASLCGANRGAFVLQPPDGNTYGCTTFPESFSTNAGLNYTIPNSANLTQSYASGDISASVAIEMVDQYISAVYASSFPGVDSNPFGCDVSGLATLVDCPNNSNNSRGGTTKKSIRPDGDIIRAVTLAGAFISQPWITGGKLVLSMEEVKEFYKSEDFVEMAKLGVNTIQIPVPCDTFFVNGEEAKTVSHLLVKAANAGLSAIVVLVAPEDNILLEHVKSAAIFASESSTVIALQLPTTSSASLVNVVRSKAAKLPILVPTNKGQLTNLSFPSDSLVFAALDVDAKSSIADIASADRVSDRLKMFYHESLVCINRSPIEWLDCYHNTPVYVSTGFDLGIDDCIHQDEDNFNDYGQCDRFNETIASGWWERHRQSLASRQLFTYSKGLGWSFSAWKLFGVADDNTSGGDSIDNPAKLLCLRDVAAAGLMPSLETTATDAIKLSSACLNVPKSDFIMGDETFAPTPGPLDCGNGWWNDNTLQCDYWIPPPPAPPAPIDYTTLMKGAAGGAIGALLLLWLVKKVTGRRYEDYQTLP